MSREALPLTHELSMTETIQIPFITAILHLTKAPIGITPSTTRAALLAVEADFTGYAAKTLVSGLNVYADLVRGGFTFQIPTQQWDTNATPIVGNDIYGGWIEDASNNLLFSWEQAVATPMQIPRQALALDQLFNWFAPGLPAKQEIEINGMPIS